MTQPLALPEGFAPVWQAIPIPVGQVSQLIAPGPWLLGGWSLATTGGTGSCTLLNGTDAKGLPLANPVIDSNLGAQFACPSPGVFADSGIFYTTTDAINVGVIFAARVYLR